LAGRSRKAELLENAGYTKEETKQIIEITENHQKKTTPEPINLESAILQDADSVDELGLIGLIRSALWHGKHNDPVYFLDSFKRPILDYPEIQKKSKSIVDHQFDKLFRLDKFMNTETGKMIARNRIEKMRSLLSQLEREIIADE